MVKVELAWQKSLEVMDKIMDKIRHYPSEPLAKAYGVIAGYIAAKLVIVDAIRSFSSIRLLYLLLLYLLL